jgi:HEAT repeat protein
MRKWLGVIGALLVVVFSADGADVNELMKQLKDKDAEIRRQAAKELSELGPDAKEALAVLVNALKDKDLYVRRFSIQAIGNIGPEAATTAIPALRGAANNPRESKEVQEAIVVALGKLGKGGVELLITAMKDNGKDSDVRRKAIESLGGIGPDAREALVSLVESLQGNPATKKGPAPGDVRIEICNALGQIASSKDDAVIKALEKVTMEKGRNRTLKAAAGSALKKIKERN